MLKEVRHLHKQSKQMPASTNNHDAGRDQRNLCTQQLAHDFRFSFDSLCAKKSRELFVRVLQLKLLYLLPFWSVE